MKWLQQLSSVPFVAVVTAGNSRARLDVAGVEGIAIAGEFGVCIGLRMTPPPSGNSLNHYLLQVAAQGLSDDAITVDEHGCLLWRRHPCLRVSMALPGTAMEKEWSRRMKSQLTLLRRLCGQSKVARSIHAAVSDLPGNGNFT